MAVEIKYIWISLRETAQLRLARCSCVGGCPQKADCSLVQQLHPGTASWSPWMLVDAGSCWELLGCFDTLTVVNVTVYMQNRPFWCAAGAVVCLQPPSQAGSIWERFFSFIFFFVGQELKNIDDIFLGINDIVLGSRTILVLLDLLHFPHATRRFAGVSYKKPEWKKVPFC